MVRKSVYFGLFALLYLFAAWTPDEPLSPNIEICFSSHIHQQFQNRDKRVLRRNSLIGYRHMEKKRALIFTVVISKIRKITLIGNNECDVQVMQGLPRNPHFTRARLTAFRIYLQVCLPILVYFLNVLNGRLSCHLPFIALYGTMPSPSRHFLFYTCITPNA